MRYVRGLLRWREEEMKEWNGVKTTTYGLCYLSPPTNMSWDRLSLQVLVGSLSAGFMTGRVTRNPPLRSGLTRHSAWGYGHVYFFSCDVTRSYSTCVNLPPGTHSATRQSFLFFLG